MADLYEWQQNAINSFKEKNKLILEVATGAGKTRVAVEIIKHLIQDNQNKILIIVPKIIILEDTWLKEFKRANIPLQKIGIYYGFAHEYSQILLTTTASVSNIPLNVYNCLIIDEVHNCYTPKMFNIIEKYNWKYMLAMSATIKDQGQRHWRLIKYFDYNIIKFDIQVAIKEKILNQFELYNYAVKINESHVLSEYSNLSYEIEHTKNKSIVKSKIKQREDLVSGYYRKLPVVKNIILKNKDKKIIIFSQYNKLSRDLSWFLVENEIRTGIVNSAVDKEYREKKLLEFEQGKINILLATRSLDEGYNLPSIDIAIILSGSFQVRQFVQRMGRVLRKKDHASKVYQIYTLDTYEEDNALKKTGMLKDSALKIVEEVF